MLNGYIEKILAEDTDRDALIRELWAYQLAGNAVMQEFCRRLGTDEPTFMPISFFKQFEMRVGEWEPQAIFESSGTTGMTPSRHFVRDVALYREVALAGFKRFFPEPSYRVLALLPSYLERGNSSLVQMVKMWMDDFGLPRSGFYLDNFDELAKAIYEGMEADEPILLIGVAFALLDFAEEYSIALPENAIVMETGGMKGRREEMIRSDLHAHLREAFQASWVSSEYGMTELLSQAYMLEDGRFHAPPWLKVVISDPHLNDLLQPAGISGRINIIDMANVHSCAFISTDDIGRQYADGSFEVLGRLDYAELRGCSLMYE